MSDFDLNGMDLLRQMNRTLTAIFTILQRQTAPTILHASPSDPTCDQQLTAARQETTALVTGLAEALTPRKDTL